MSFLFAVAFNGTVSFVSDAAAQYLEIRYYGKKRQQLSAKRAEVPTLKGQQLEETHKEIKTLQEELGHLGESSYRGVKFSMPRALKFTATGVIFCGVISWARLALASLIVPQAGLVGCLEKTLIHEGLLAPLVRVASMATIQYLESSNWHDVKDKIRADFWEAQIVSWGFKIPTSSLVFWLFPFDKDAQLVAIRLFSFLYNTYYSYVTHRAFTRTEEDESDKAK
eukprot:TRINITY_DN93191_c0_g1_i1.p1 TRINITY_DN93191_c0_g1~~TRINITY_DN93191_c0_g1_i1.p1  ORF type:complete len:239 (-),score=36.47 TRINITY_DN93191_c0_g1_i1:38-709(-)